MVVPELVGEIDIAHVACAANLLRAIRAASFVDERHDVFRRQFLVLRHRDYGRDAPGRSDDTSTTVAFVLDPAKFGCLHATAVCSAQYNTLRLKKAAAAAST